MLFGFQEQLGKAHAGRFHFSNKFAREVSGADFLQHRFHPVSRSSTDDFRPNRQLAPFGGIGDQFAHTRDSRFVNKIDDEFEFVEAFEVGKLRWIAGGNECIETSPNECGCSSAQDRLFTEKVGLRLLTKSCFDHARARATNALSPGQGGSFRMPAGILVNCDHPAI